MQAAFKFLKKLAANNNKDWFDSHKNEYLEVKEIYEACGYTVMLTSLANNEGVTEIKELLKDKVTLLSGHSGVGKSTFINAIFPILFYRIHQPY